MNDRLLSLLGLARRAGRLSLGNDPVLSSMEEGKAKLVQIDEDGNVSTVVECTPDSEVNELTTYSIQLKEGKNRLKFVGYDCKNVTFYMEIKES